MNRLFPVLMTLTMLSAGCGQTGPLELPQQARRQNSAIQSGGFEPAGVESVAKDELINNSASRQPVQ